MFQERRPVFMHLVADDEVGKAPTRLVNDAESKFTGRSDQVPAGQGGRLTDPRRQLFLVESVVVDVDPLCSPCIALLSPFVVMRPRPRSGLSGDDLQNEQVVEVRDAQDLLQPQSHFGRRTARPRHQLREITRGDAGPTRQFVLRQMEPVEVPPHRLGVELDSRCRLPAPHATSSLLARSSSPSCRLSGAGATCPSPEALG